MMEEGKVGDTPGSELQSQGTSVEYLRNIPGWFQKLFWVWGQDLSSQMVLGSKSALWLTNSKTGVAMVLRPQLSATMARTRNEMLQVMGRLGTFIHRAREKHTHAHAHAHERARAHTHTEGAFNH